MHSIRIKIVSVTIAAVLTSILALGGLGILTIGIESDRNSVEKMRLLSENMQQKSARRNCMSSEKICRCGWTRTWTASSSR